MFLLVKVMFALASFGGGGCADRLLDFGEVQTDFCEQADDNTTANERTNKGKRARRRAVRRELARQNVEKLDVLSGRSWARAPFAPACASHGLQYSPSPYA